MNELTAITHPDSSTETLTYDDNGNLTQTTRNSETTAYTWDIHDRLTKVTLPSGEEIEFTYDGEDQLVSIDYPEMSIDLKQMDGDIIHRVAKVKFNNEATPMEKEISSYDVIVGGKIRCRYGSGPDTGANMYNSGKAASSPLFYHYDHNSNISLMTDIYGNIVARFLFDAFGNQLPLPDSQNSGITKYKFDNLLTGALGVIYIQKANIYNMRRRFYYATYRRFLSVDPLFTGKKDYNYVSNNPVDHTDSTGLVSMHSSTAYELTRGKLKDIKDSSGMSLMQKFNKVIQDINYTYTQKGGRKNWYCAFKQTCTKAITQRQVDDIWNSAQYKFLDDDLSIDLADDRAKAPISAGNYEVKFGYFLLSSSVQFIRTVFTHELGHLFYCNIRDFQRRHFCCDVIGWKLGFASHSPGTNFKSDVNTIFEQIISNERRRIDLPKIDKEVSINLFKGLRNKILKSYQSEKDKGIYNIPRYNAYPKHLKFSSWKNAANDCKKTAGKRK